MMETLTAGAVEKSIRRLIDRKQLARIEITTRDGKSFTARAFPASYSRVVEERTKRAFASAGKSDFSITEATAIRNEAVEAELASAHGATIELAIAELAKAL